DVNLPDGDGFDALKELRQSSRVPVIMLTAANTPTDRVLGLEIGADDYIAKPFEPRELIARIKTVLRRAGASGESPVGNATEQLIFGGFTLDLDMRSLVDAQNQPVTLTGAEFDLLRCLAEAPGRPLTRDRILDITRSRDWSPLDRSIDVLIGRLRKKLEADADSPAIIKTVRGIGYVMSVPVRRVHAGKG
ncbi:MAG: response regulator transcription factor, partial [Alphaproteobacteria bacterium]|nr:response regulator transcription factor [Alphaproteobacteria bacterium]